MYEVPSKFNIDESAYMKLVDKLYDTIKILRQEFEKSEEKTWTNLTISIENFKFHVEYDYEDLLSSSYSSYDRHIIWQYKYLNFGVERLSKRDRQMLEEYLIQEQFENKDTKRYTEGMYKNNIHNMIEYDIEEKEVKVIETNNRKETTKLQEKNLDKYELYKRKKEEEKKNQIPNVIEKQENKKKNQILNF